MTYQIVRYEDRDCERALSELENIVGAYIVRGYKPIGGVAITQEKDGCYIVAQTMIKG